MARWALEEYRISERHAARLVQLAINTLRYCSRKVFDEVLWRRLRELAGTHVRYGYRRLTRLPRRQNTLSYSEELERDPMIRMQLQVAQINAHRSDGIVSPPP